MNHSRTENADEYEKKDTKKKRRRSRSRSREQKNRHSPSRNSHRKRSWSRSRSPVKHRSQNRSNSPNYRRRARSRSRSPRGRSRSRDRSRRRSRSREKRRNRSGSIDRELKESSRREKFVDKAPPLDPTVGHIYDGKVTSIMQFGCFVQLDGLRKRWEGLVHISQLRREGRVTNVADVVSRGQKVKIKVLSFNGQKTSLSMKDVDQETGEDLNPTMKRHEVGGDLSEAARNPDRPLMAPLVKNIPEQDDGQLKKVQRISSPERWELKQACFQNCYYTLSVVICNISALDKIIQLQTQYKP